MHLAGRCVVTAAPVRRPQVVQRPGLPAGRTEPFELRSGGGMVLHGDREVALGPRDPAEQVGRRRLAEHVSGTSESGPGQRSGLARLVHPAQGTQRGGRVEREGGPQRVRRAAGRTIEQAMRMLDGGERLGEPSGGELPTGSFATHRRLLERVAGRDGRGLETLERLALGVPVGQHVQGAHQAAERDPSDVVALADVQGPTEVRDGEREARRREGGDTRLERIARDRAPQPGRFGMGEQRDHLMRLAQRQLLQRGGVELGTPLRRDPLHDRVPGRRVGEPVPTAGRHEQPGALQCRGTRGELGVAGHRSPQAVVERVAEHRRSVERVGVAVPDRRDLSADDVGDRRRAPSALGRHAAQRDRHERVAACRRDDSGGIHIVAGRSGAGGDVGDELGDRLVAERLELDDGHTTGVPFSDEVPQRRPVAAARRVGPRRRP